MNSIFFYIHNYFNYYNFLNFENFYFIKIHSNEQHGGAFYSNNIIKINIYN